MKPARFSGFVKIDLEHPGKWCLLVIFMKSARFHVSQFEASNISAENYLSQRSCSQVH